MESRLDKYYIENLESETESCASTRSNRNAKLYRQVYGKYEDLDNLPIEDNTDEIDLDRLKELISNSNKEQTKRDLREHLDILDTRKRKIDEQKLYDINKILEKAKNDNNKLNNTSVRESIINKNILSTLESKKISLSEIREASIKYEQEESKEIEEKELKITEEIKPSIEIESENLTMTREFKFKELSEKVEKFNSNPLTTQVMPDNDLSLDLFEELKPTGNTIITKPIKDEIIETDMHSSDTRDIDIIKPAVSGNLEEFFTNSYEFSKKDFADLSDEEDTFFENKKENNVLKIILLIIAIIIFIGAIVYFVKTYGLGL